MGGSTVQQSVWQGTGLPVWGLTMLVFMGYHVNRQNIDGGYVCGLSLTHGAPGSRQHIWTFASGRLSLEMYRSKELDVHVIMATPTPHLLLWAMTISVRVFLLSHILNVSSIQMLCSGMARFVMVVAHVASSTIHHGSPRT